MNKILADIKLFLRNHSYLVRAIGIVIVSFIVIFVGVISTWQRMSEVRSELEVKERSFEDLSQRVVVLNGLNSEVLSRRVAILDSVLPPSKDIVAYLTALDGLSRELGLSLGGISLNPGEVSSTGTADTGAKKSARSQAALSSLDTEIRIAGNSGSIYEFLRNIENTAPLMLVKDVQMNKVGSDDSYLLTLRLSMLYSFPTPSTLKGVVSLFTQKEEDLYESISGFNIYTVRTSETTSINVGKDNLFDSLGVTGQDQLPDLGELIQNQFEESPEGSPSAQE